MHDNILIIASSVGIISHLQNNICTLMINPQSDNKILYTYVHKS